MSTLSAKEPTTEPTGGSYHHGNLRVALVEAGLAMLEESPSAELSLRELARRVGVSPNATYRHFANKEALLEALAAEGFRRFTVALMRGALHSQGGQGAAGQENLDRFIGAGHGYITFACRNPALFRLMFSRFAGRHHNNDELRLAATTAYDVLKRGVASSHGLDINDQGVAIAALHAWSIVHGLSHLVLDGQISERGDALDTLIDAVIRGGPLMAHLFAPGPRG